MRMIKSDTQSASAEACFFKVCKLQERFIENFPSMRTVSLAMTAAANHSRICTMI